MSTAALNITLIHARPYSPQGKGKIERWFKTVRSGFLSGFCGRTIDELNEALELWIDHVYHRTKHSAIGQTPFARFTAHLADIRPAPGDLKSYFRKVVRRRVAKDRSITFNGRLYEAPVDLIDQRVELLYHEGDETTVEIRADGKSYGYARELDLHVKDIMPTALLRIEVLAELHTLCQFHKDAGPYLPMILVGQAQLIDKLSYRASAALASRVVARSHLEGVNREDMALYLQHHLSLAGIKSTLFDEVAVTAVHQGANGLLRKANHLARGALIAAAKAESQTVTAEHVRLAATELF